MTGSPRVLLLTDMPPCDNYTAGIVTAQLCRVLPRDGLAMFCVLNRHLHPEPCPDLAWLPQRTVRKPNEVGRRRWRGIPLPGAVATGVELTRRLAWPRLVRQAAALGRAHGTTVVWAVLQGQTLVRMALPLAHRLGVPLLVHVWDPLEWWLAEHRVDPFNARLDLAAFDRTVQAAAGCAAASWAMADAFRDRYGIPGEPLFAAIPCEAVCHPPAALRRPDEVMIGMAGQFYAEPEWLRLVAALADAGWKVADRAVRLLVLGNHSPPGDIPPDRIDWRGWLPQADAVRVLSEECDVLYCAYPFADSMRDVARLSFPSKLPTYFAAGRPVLFHGPGESSPARYLQQRQAAELVTEASPTALYEGLTKLVNDTGRYGQIATAGSAAFQADFSPRHQAEAISRILATAGPAGAACMRAG